MLLYVPVNSYGHVIAVSSPNHTFFMDKLDQFPNKIVFLSLKIGFVIVNGVGTVEMLHYVIGPAKQK